GSVRYDGLPMHPPSPDYVPVPEHPPSPDYVPGPEHPPSPVYVSCVSEPAYPEFMPPGDDVFPAEEQPLPVAVSPTADSPGYITESGPKEDPKEDDEDPEEDPTDYSANRDDDEEEEEESSGDDADDEEDEEGGDEEEEEHLAPAYSVLPPTYCTTARMSIRALTPIPFPSDAEVDRLLAIPTPPSSPLTSLSSPLPRIPSPPFLVSLPLPISPLPLPISPTNPLGFKAAMIRASMVMMRAAAPSTYILAPRSETPPSGTPPLLPIPVPTSSPPWLLPSTDCRADVPEVMLPPQKRLCFATGPRYEIKECSSAPTARPTRGFREEYRFVGTLDAEIRRDLDREVGYGITNTWDEMVEAMHEIAPTTLEGVNQRVTDLVTTVRTDTDEVYGRLDDAYDDRSLISGHLNLLRRDRHSHACTARLMESEARASREAWLQSMDASDMARFEVRALQAMVLAQQTEIGDLRAADSRRQKMEPTRRNTRASPATTTTTTPVTNVQLKALIDQGVAGAFAARDADRSQNGDDSHNSETVENQVMFATCTLHGVALTWWKSHVKTVGQDAAHAMPWNTLMKMMNANYTQRFQELALMCGGIFFKESNKIEKYVGGLPDMIHRSVMASKPKTTQDAVEFATELMDKKIRTFDERQTENKRNFEDTSRNNQNQQ
ncbi:hypothetical protein Tco_0511400, partial [Tanacetum coccineum]